ncbi:choline/ethanolamine kinase [Syncephalis pseudoplumigaleata]|uniref:ethanolamine kinase n=1 Tax=Syncephalis pseudoplumigaleata TaxID=1712513 RepID=A0A4P9Z2K2_9FUNG|nr:choline/ethanolamine kinase [Syncephalis pseudoplumigaleata]|eukprot:RKP26588.1 choline/ethanolamine kinase [Syncephalis pseudoplumigaleata]
MVISSHHQQQLKAPAVPPTEADVAAYLDEHVRVIDRPVRHTHLFEDAVAIVQTVFADWTADDLKLVQCKDGITNKLVRCTHVPSQTNVLIRAYGRRSEVIIDRKQEITNIVCLAKLDLSPPLYGRFNNGLVYGFIPGQMLLPEQLTDPHMGRCIARKLARWHQVRIPGSVEAKLFPTLWRWMDEVPSEYNNAQTQATYLEKINLPELKAELKQLQARLEQLDAPVVFAHNDLLAGNLIYNEEKDEVSFIDYEYGCYNYRGFDIGNHFNEYAGFECAYERYPTKEAQLPWLRQYLTSAGATVTDATLETLYREVNQFALASHFYWGLWALVQAELSNIDFDYISYAVLRFNEYYRRRDEFLAI